MTPGSASVELFWLPLGAGGASRLVRWSGIVFESIVARREHRTRCDLYHSALEVHLDGNCHVIEMTPVWGNKAAVRGVVGEGPVGLRQLRCLAIVGYLAYVYGYVPKLLGVLLVVAGAGYIFDSAASTVLASPPGSVATVTFLGELLLAVWLLARSRHITPQADSYGL